MTHFCSAVPSNQNFMDAPLDAGARGEIERAIEAVCAELGFGPSRETSRAKVADGIVNTWRNGRRHPLNLVNAGLNAVCF